MDWAQASAEQVALKLIELGFDGNLVPKNGLQDVVVAVKWCRTMKFVHEKPKLTKNGQGKYPAWKTTSGMYVSVKALFTDGEIDCEYYNTMYYTPTGSSGLVLNKRLYPFVYQSISEAQAEILSAACPNLKEQYLKKEKFDDEIVQNKERIADSILAKKPGIKDKARQDAAAKFNSVVSGLKGLWDLDDKSIITLMKIMDDRPGILEYLQTYVKRNDFDRHHWDLDFVKEARAVADAKHVMSE